MIDKRKMVFIAIAIGIVLTVSIYRSVSDRSDFMSMAFDGKVQQVGYDFKDAPTIKVNGKEFYLGVTENFKHQIEVGDSIFKLKGRKWIELKKKGGEIIHFGY
ncbi:hypothetical protein EZ428_18700 [Pedobacter frigiditerrae]|uniref:Uncharacterized protein n=1 Tax=Pedobacter frigiditerrae TaxID=2530452 RepID=A0A4R0MPB2_9SPHI|nr:hypothetical protein [Pedobacter frigiditerrae]TCC88668.1 hypothetical protein EZ428_18700 [Pedobacter frigiditerrae]